MSERDEIERLRRLRERQLAARDPTAKDRQFQKTLASRYVKKRVTLIDVVSNIPAKWIGTILGGVIGFILALVLDQVLHLRLPNVSGFWVEYIWYSLVFLGVAMGRGLAAAIDWSEEDYDHLVLRK
jgi:hypothetical protein